MSRSIAPDDRALELVELEHIVAACDRYEAAWRGGQRPHFEQFVNAGAEQHRARLFRELLALDLEFRRACGERPSPEEYQRRFPLHGNLVSDAFQPTGTTDDRPGTPPVAPVGPGSRIGPFKILQTLGEGGMGVVYSAEQEKPVRRRVALKVIKVGMDSDQVIARFEAERQALALMDHPHIAKVLDVGTTDSGRPYFAMELIKGIPITQYCDEARLTTDERLRLFIPVCEAIQHAHQKGVIHRDVKPSNVLVTLVEGKPVPKVIDFGVAKAVDQRLTERTLFTQVGMIVGTLEYMSPEQAELSGMDVDTRSDVYSLGVMLYELLTGSTPLQRERLRRAGYAEIVRQIKEVEPPKPSTRLGTSGKSLTAIALKRRAEPSRLAKMVRGDLDCIVMKALEKNRTRRYETANGFARDIARYMDGEPVEACPPSASYRLRKLAARHRTGLVVAAAASATLVAVTAFTTSMWLQVGSAKQRLSRQNAELTRANSEIKQANEKLTVVNRREEEARKRAQGLFELAVEAVRASGPKLRPDATWSEAEVVELRTKVFSNALGFFRELQSELENDPDPIARSHLADAYLNASYVFDATGHQRDGLVAITRALSIREQLAGAAPNTLELRLKLADLYQRISASHAGLFDFSRAAEFTDKACNIMASVVRDYPGERKHRRELARAFTNCGVHLGNMHKDAMALDRYQKAYSLGGELCRDGGDSSDLRCLEAIASLYGGFLNQLGRHDEAEQMIKQARALDQALLAEQPDQPGLLLRLSFTYSRMGEVESSRGRDAQAIEECSKARDMRQKLVRIDHTNLAYREDLANVQRFLGFLFRRSGDPLRAIGELRAARDLYEDSLRELPEHPRLRRYLADSATEVLAAEQQAHSSDRLPEDLARAERALVSLASPTPVDLYNLACVDALMGAREGSGDLREKAVGTLRRAIAAGYKNVGLVRSDPDLDSIRSHPVYQSLILDMVFPANPFAN
jgi:serine/threonine protein kinase